MSKAKDLDQRTSGLSAFLDRAVVGGTREEGSERGPKTVPGRLLLQRNMTLSAEEAVAKLEDRLALYDGSAPERQLDPKTIRPSKYMNRLEANWSTPEFEAFKQQIALSGGNVEPILVRPLQEPKGVEQFEIAFGLRRHRACLEQGLMVRAVVRSMTDQELHAAMTFENEGGIDLSPYEKGKHYQRALDEKLYSTQEQLAATYGKTQGFVSRLLRLARLPSEVVSAFPTPLDIKVVWLEPLEGALENDRASMLARAKELVEKGPQTLAPAAIFKRLVAKKSSEKTINIKHAGKQTAVIKFADGKTTVTFRKGRVPGNELDKLKKTISEFLVSIS